VASQTAAVAAAIRMRGVGLVSPAGEVILRDLDWEVDEGAIAVVVGPSGAGKSRLLRLINRLDEPSAGELDILGRPQVEWEVGALRRAIGWVPQRPSLADGTGADNLDLPVRLGLVADRSGVGRAAAIAGLDDALLARPVTQLSGGERHRVALARALVLEPRVLLLDEPSSALHGAAAAGVLGAVKDWCASRRVTMCVVTHRIDDLDTLGGQLVVLEAGRIARRGPAAELVAEPAIRHLMTGREEAPA
jgi:ABC-type methionine transport system ATPase subunit